MHLSNRKVHLLNTPSPRRPSRVVRWHRKHGGQITSRSEICAQSMTATVSAVRLPVSTEEATSSEVEAAIELMQSVEHSILPSLNAMESCLLGDADGSSVALMLSRFLSLTAEARALASATLLLLPRQVQSPKLGPAARSGGNASLFDLAVPKTSSHLGMLGSGIMTGGDLIASTSKKSQQQRNLSDLICACMQLMAALGLTEARVLHSPAIYAAVLAETQLNAAEGVHRVLLPGTPSFFDERCGNTEDTPPGLAGPGSSAEQLLTQQGHKDELLSKQWHTDVLHQLLTRLRQEGYHPDQGGASLSVILSAEEKLAHVQELWREERLVLEAIRHALHSNQASTDVELTEEELLLDPLMADLVRHQQQLMEQERKAGPQGDQASSSDPPPSLRLDLMAAKLLLRLHPDGSVRRQVYETAVEARCLTVLDGMDQLAAIRRKIALSYDLDSFSAWSHMTTSPGNPSDALQLLVGLAEALRPAAAKKLELLRLHMSALGQDELHPWDIDWAQHGLLPASAGWDYELRLCDVMDRLSAYLEPVMGISLRRLEGRRSDSSVRSTAAALPTPVSGDGANARALGDVCVGPEGSGAVHRFLQSLLGQQQGAVASGSESASEDSCDPGGGGGGNEAPLMMYSVHVEGRGEVGYMVLDRSGGFGTRFFTTGSAAASLLDELPLSESQSEHLPVVLVGLSWPNRETLFSLDSEEAVGGQHQQQQGGRDPMGAAASGLFELLHEMGHAMHYLLSSSSSSNSSPFDYVGDGPGQADPGRISSAAAQVQSGSAINSIPLQQWPLACPSFLPLELLEVPSSLFERMAMHPTVLSHLLPSAMPPVHVQAFASYIQASVYCPVKHQIQVLSMLLDQLMCACPALEYRPGPGGVQTWVQLCRDFLPGLPPTFTVQQASSLARVTAARGQAYGYTSAWMMASLVWIGSGMEDNPMDPESGRRLRTCILDSAAACDMQASIRDLSAHAHQPDDGCYVSLPEVDYVLLDFWRHSISSQSAVPANEKNDLA